MKYISWIWAIIVTVILIFKSCNHNSSNQDNSILIDSLNKISIKYDSLQSVRCQLKDSINIIDSTIFKIKYEHKKDISTILTQPVDSDCKFFSNYLSENSKRFFNCNNSDTIKTN